MSTIDQSVADDAVNHNQEPVADQAPAQGEPDKGFPANTSTADMTPEQELAYWKHESRKQTRINRERGDYDAIKAKADQLDELQREQQTDHERALADARAQASKEAFTANLPRLLNAELRARFVPADVVDEQIELLDLTKFVTDSGDLDADRLDRFAANLVPADRQNVLADFTRLGPPPSGAQKSLADLTAERRAALTSNIPSNN